jgi:hypothetical protein
MLEIPILRKSSNSHAISLDFLARFCHDSNLVAGSGAGMSYEEIVAEFIRTRRRPLRDFLQGCKKQPDMASAITHAILPDGRKHSRQYRISFEMLDKAMRCLQRVKANLEKASDFDGLHATVEDTIGRTRGIGSLTVYDIALRIGAFLGKALTKVYLHGGTRVGAAMLDFKGKMLDPKKLDPAFARLSAAELEDCLCHYRDCLRNGGIPPDRPRKKVC